MFSRIYLDLDDVLVDFDGAVCRLFGACPLKVGETRNGHWSVNHWGIQGLNCKTLIEEIDRIGPSFWDLEKLPWFDTLLDVAFKQAHEVYILSCPSLFKSSKEGKTLWFESTGLANRGVQLILDKDKHNYAKPDTLLIDDRETNCFKFMLNNGCALLFPSFGNYCNQVRLSFLSEGFPVKEWFENGIRLSKRQ